MNDFELVKEKNYAELWKKYIPLMNKFYEKAITSALKIGLFIPYENSLDFQADCYPILINAVDSIKLEKIKKPETWTLYIQFYRYLQNFVYRQVIRPLIRNNNLEFIDEVSNSTDNLLDGMDAKLSLEAIYTKLSIKEKQILEEFIHHEGRMTNAQRQVILKIRKMYKK